MKTKPFLMLAFMLMATGFVSKPLFSTPDIQPPAGRIAIVADGNSPDPDDLGATAVSIALLRAAGLEDRLVHYSHSCDLVRGSRISEEDEFKRHGLMQTACDGTASRWGGFELFTFYDAMWQKEQTIEDLRDAINASSATDPLWIVEAGEPDIIGFALEASDADKYQYVKVITHHPANDDAGDFYTWQQILDFGIEEVRIPDQNTHLKVDLAHWDWAKNHSNPRIQWIWSQGKIAEEDHVVKFQKGMWDCSDAGMILYWITGATSGGLEEGSVTDVKELLLEYVARNPQSFQDGDIQKTLNDINTRFKNVEVSIVNWPDDLQQKLGKLKKSAFMASPRFESTGKLPLLISLHGAGGKTWSLDEQLARSATVKGLSLVEWQAKN